MDKAKRKANQDAIVASSELEAAVRAYLSEPIGSLESVIPSMHLDKLIEGVMSFPEAQQAAEDLGIWVHPSRK